jgi:hypothetical protein
MQYTKEQVREMEHVILNMLTPVHGNLSVALMKGKIKTKDIEMMIAKIDDVADWIRAQR